MVSVGMPLVFNMSISFKRIANVYAGIGWGQIDRKGANLAATNRPEPSNSWAGPTRGQGIGDLRCGSALPSATEEMTTRVLGPAPVSC